MEQKTLLDKLRILLPHWVEHSYHHGEDFHKWAKLAREEGRQELADLLDQAIDSMKVTDGILEKALRSVGGADNGQVQAHQHEHTHAHHHGDHGSHHAHALTHCHTHPHDHSHGDDHDHPHD